jgi:hypothetical protein
MGLWPDSGQHRTIDVDESCLMRAVDLVVDTAAALLESRRALAEVAA